MIPAVIAAAGAAASLASSIIGAVGSAKATREANALINTQKVKNRNWYDSQVSQDYMQRSDTQAILKKQKELLDAQYNRAAATNVVAGGTDEALAMQTAQANDTVADTLTNIAGERPHSAADRSSAGQGRTDRSGSRPGRFSRSQSHGQCNQIKQLVWERTKKRRKRRGKRSRSLR